MLAFGKQLKYIKSRNNCWNSRVLHQNIRAFQAGLPAISRLMEGSEGTGMFFAHFNTQPYRRSERLRHRLQLLSE